MNVEILFMWAIGLLGTISVCVMGWTVMQLFRLNTRLSKHELETAQTYITKAEHSVALGDIKTEMRQGFAGMKEGLTRIYDKLDGKQDKRTGK